MPFNIASAVGLKRWSALADHRHKWVVSEYCGACRFGQAARIYASVVEYNSAWLWLTEMILASLSRSAIRSRLPWPLGFAMAWLPMLFMFIFCGKTVVDAAIPPLPEWPELTSITVVSPVWSACQLIHLISALTQCIFGLCFFNVMQKHGLQPGCCMCSISHTKYIYEKKTNHRTKYLNNYNVLQAGNQTRVSSPTQSCCK